MNSRKKHGLQTYVFDNPPVIASRAAVVGPKEGEPPWKHDFDLILPDYNYGEQTWEKAEAKMLEQAVRLALAKKQYSTAEIEIMLAGDLLNQIISSNFSARQLEIPFLGIYGACSSMAESVLLACMLLDGGFCSRTVAAVCSHHYTAQRQYRTPVEQGVQFPAYSQWTATAAGAVVLEAGETQPAPALRITSATVGKVIDRGQNDPANMGAAMAPAAVSTIAAHFADMGTSTADYDLILTGDLGTVGHELACRLLERQGITELENFQDCGMLLYDASQPDVHAGASGCGCSASMLCGPLLNHMEKGKYRKILFVPTGALMSPLSGFQGETIPGIAHAIVIEAN